MVNLVNLVKYSGAPGLFVLVGTAFLLFKVAGSVGKDERSSLAPWAVAAFALIGVGFLGTLWGFVGIERTLAQAYTGITPAQLASARLQAWSSTILGACGAAAVLGLVGVVLFARRRAAPTPALGT
jgi:hypothetical protein